MAEALALPLLLLRHDGLLLNANMAGYAALAQGGCLMLSDAKVVPVQASQNSDFLDALAQASKQGGRCFWTAGAGAGAGSVSGATDTITISAVPSAQVGDTRMVLVMLPAQAALSEACTLFAYQYGLSAGELSVLLALCQGRTPSDIAAARGVSASTVRTQMTRLRRKCGEHTLNTLLPRVGQLPPVWAERFVAPDHKEQGE